MIGQGSTEQQDKGEEDAEVSHGEICRPREMHLRPGTVGRSVLRDLMAIFWSHSVSSPGDPHRPRLPLDHNPRCIWVLRNRCLVSEPWP